MTAATPARTYHHGDLPRALLDAALALLVEEGPAALSLRAVAKAAGVSPAAPYHHFPDKAALIHAVGGEGFTQLHHTMSKALSSVETPRERLMALGIAYVEFAKTHPALYRVMYDCARDDDTLPDPAQKRKESAFNLIKSALVDTGRYSFEDQLSLEQACIAAWCAVHGVAEMVSLRQFEQMKRSSGGAQTFLRSLLGHLLIFQPLAA